MILEDDSDPIPTDYVAQTETTSLSDDSYEEVADNAVIKQISPIITSH